MRSILHKVTFRVIERKFELLFVLLLVFIWYCILHNANWLFMGSMAGDDYQFLMTTAVGKASHGSTWSSRFWPLGLSDYSLLLLFGQCGRTAVAHYIWNSVTLVISFLLMFEIIYKTTKNFLSTYVALLFAFISSGFAQIHMECIYSERMISFVICVFLFSAGKAQKSQNVGWYVLAFIMAAYSTYMKELVFVIFLVFAIIQLLFNKLSGKDKAFYVALICNSLIFISLYGYRRIFKPQKDVYATVISSVSEISFSQFLNEPILILIVALSVIRAYSVLIKHDREDLITDAALLAAVAYAFCYFLLNLHHGYYLYPSVVLSLPAFAVFFNKSRLHFLVGLFSLTLCGYLNFPQSKSIVINDWNHRESDHKIFEKIVSKSKKGWSIYWLSDVADKTKEVQYWHYDRIMCLNRFQHFLKYYNSNTVFPILLVFDTNKFCKNSIVIINKTTLDRKSFKGMYDSFKTFSPKQIAEINGNLIYEIRN